MNDVINKCLCGCVSGSLFKRYKLSLIQCDRCGLIRQKLSMDKNKLLDFYSQKYQQVYSHKYNQDLETALLRLNKYKLKLGIRLLDIGCGKGAFVSCCLDKGIDAYGVDLIDEKEVEIAEYYKGELTSIYFPTDYFDVITCHDVIEHLFNPLEYIKEAFRILKQKGKFIVEIPRFYSDEGVKHWKELEHIWFFKVEELKQFLIDVGFKVNKIYNPVSTKYVYVCSKPVMKRVSIIVPPGIGDSYWSLIKIKDFCDKNGLGIPDIFISCPVNGKSYKRAFDFVQNCPFVNAAGYLEHKADKEPFYEAYHKDAKSIYKKVEGKDYFISYNGKMRFGKSPDTEDLKYKADWFYPQFESIEEKWMKEDMKEAHDKYIVAYFISHGMYGRWLEEFSIANIKELLLRINQNTGYKIVFIGAEWDREFISNSFMNEPPPKCFIDLTGKTTLRQCFGVIKASEGVIGFPSGVTIMSTVFRKPTFMFWNKYFNELFWKDACPPQAYKHWYDFISTDKATLKTCCDKISNLFKIKFKKNDNKSSKQKLIITTVLRTGGDFTLDYVRRLKNMLEKKVSINYDFVVLSDVDIDFCDTVKLQKEDWKLWWCKIELFRKGIFDLSKRIFFFDLDMILVRNIDELLSYDGEKFFMMGRYRNPNKRSSAIMSWKGDYSFLYDRLCENSLPMTLKGKTDQDYIERQLRMEGLLAENIVQDYINVRSFKRHCLSGIPEETHIIGFHGHPRPHEVAAEWLKKLWG